MITAWRICKEKLSATAFDGLGAKALGGRWNSPGVGVVYSSSSPAQALLELLVHADVTLLSLSYVLIPVTFPDLLILSLDRALLSRDWKLDQKITRKSGDDWITRSPSAILRVPSAIIDVEDNFLINPAHPDMRRVVIGPAQPLIIDERIRELFRK